MKPQVIRIIDAREDHAAEFGDVHTSTQLCKQRQIDENLRRIALACSGSKLALAAMIQQSDPEVLLNTPRARFKSISLHVLAMHLEINLSAHLLGDRWAREQMLVPLVQSFDLCHLSDCDVFWLHSWSDDAQSELVALQAWCQAFEDNCRRQPRLWLDTVCVDESHIEENLKCLLVFPGGCKSLGVTVWPTYPTRLWCLLFRPF